MSLTVYPAHVIPSLAGTITLQIWLGHACNHVVFVWSLALYDSLSVQTLVRECLWASPTSILEQKNASLIRLNLLFRSVSRSQCSPSNRGARMVSKLRILINLL